ncbi:hypothetical protein H7Y21_00595 [Arenimonas sp.]|nr:hypothetical protein [Candidatus Parcubacteria bacterium]
MKLNELAKSHHLSRGRKANTFNKVSVRSSDRLEEELGITSGKAKPTTHARLIACAFIKNAISFAAMNALMVPKCHPTLVLNSDATQFEVGCDSDQKISVKYVGSKSDRKSR